MYNKSVLDIKINMLQLLAVVLFGYWIAIFAGQMGPSLSSRGWLILVYLLTISVITGQAAWFLYWMLFTLNDPDQAEKNKSPKTYIDPRYSFTALLPARDEKKVIGDTIRAIANIDYPEHLKELLILIRGDDIETIEEASRAMILAKKDNIRIIIVNDTPINKPNQLNWGLAQAQKDVVVIFDAEDQPHADLYKVANTVMAKKRVDVVQSGVQLMNYQTKWFSAWNVLEYYFWFKSALHYFASQGVVPLGGNTVFFKRSWLNAVGGWDENCLTEDADIGIRLSLKGAKMAIVYDENHATQEETPDSTKAFIKQRTRWNQGYLQIFFKGDWLKLPTLKQKLLAGYLLILPEILVSMFCLSTFLTVAVSRIETGVPIAMFSYLPLGLMLLQVTVSTAALWQFAKEYKKKFKLWMIPKLILGFVPYVGVQGFGASRAIIRFASHNLTWEKTSHVNAHREVKLGYPDIEYAVV